MDLDIVRIECEATTNTPDQFLMLLHDSLKTFEAHFRDSCCSAYQKSCASCSQKSECPYGVVFSQKLSSDPDIVRLHQKPPLPFSLYIKPLDSNTSTITIGLVVIGSAVNYLEYFHAALLRMVETNVCSILNSVNNELHFYSLDYHGDRHEITSVKSLPESVILLSGKYILQSTVHSDSARLALKSPLRLLSNGSIAQRFDFAAFFRSELRRCSSLWAYYGTGEMKLDFVKLSELSQNVILLNNKIIYTSSFLPASHIKPGLIGSTECFGLVEPMFSLLLLGSYFNAGKNASSGSGFYEIKAI